MNFIENFSSRTQYKMEYFLKDASSSHIYVRKKNETAFITFETDKKGFKLNKKEKIHLQKHFSWL